MKKYLVPGLILILAGVYFLIEALPGVSLPFGAFFALVGAALLVGRLFARGKYGLSIAGFLLLCLGLAWALLAAGAQVYPYFQPEGAHCEADWCKQNPLYFDFLFGEG